MTIDFNFILLPVSYQAPLPPDWRLVVGLFAVVVTVACYCH